MIKLFIAAALLVLCSCSASRVNSPAQFRLIASDTFLFNSFVDCNMATVWVKDTFRIFPGKYGEDPLWGEAHELKFASGKTVDEVFLRKPEQFTEPSMPQNAAPGEEGLHGAVWFETLYKDANDTTDRTLYALYHNENYPSTLPYDAATGVGYRNEKWPQGLKGAETKTAVCRIGIMKSGDGGHSWSDKGIVLQDHQPRLILKPHNTGINFAGGVGDPSAVVSENYLYIFYGEYGYPGAYDLGNYQAEKEWAAQCISVARIAIADLDSPAGKAKRWDGKGFNVKGDGVGTPVASLQIPRSEGGGPASSATAKYHWGPSVSWNEHLNAWVMLMARAEGPSWKGGNIYISFNKNRDLGEGNNSQQWTKPELLISKPNHTIWYPSLQPVNTAENIHKRYTSLRLGKEARLFFKEMDGKTSHYLSYYTIEFNKK